MYQIRNRPWLHRRHGRGRSDTSVVGRSVLQGYSAPVKSNELIPDARSLELGAHISWVYSFKDIVKCASKHSRLNQLLTWEVLDGLLGHGCSVDLLMYCGTEQSLWCQESNQHPGNTEKKAIGVAVTCSGYVEVQSAPHAYGHSAEAEGEDPKRVSLLRTFNPQI
jgi:hypothetical protein